MELKKLIAYLETIASPIYQESYDNSGLIVGNPNIEIEGVLVCLDSTEDVLEEAISKDCNVVIAHHPIVFKGLKSITGRNYVERVILKAIKNDIAIYAIHTNLDNVYQQGVNARIAERLGLQNTQVLAPKVVNSKISIFTSALDSDKIRQRFAPLAAITGSGFSSLGVQNGKDATIKMELHFPNHLEHNIIKVLSEVQQDIDIHYEISALQNVSKQIGSGMIGELESAVSEETFLEFLKNNMQVEVVRHTQLLGKSIKRVAVCGGAGSFLLPHAIRQKADIFITADFKYHEFFDADQRIIIADIGHYESEQFTINLLQELISKKFTNFAAHFTTIRTNPVFYY